MLGLVADPLKAVANTRPAAAATRALMRSGVLSDSARERVYRRFAKKLQPALLPTFSHQVPGGGSLVLHSALAAKSLYFLGRYESSTMRVFLSLAQQSRTVLDIGAQVGIYGLFAASVNPSSTVLAFEVDPQALAILTEHIRLNDLAEQVKAVAVALGARDGVSPLNLQGGTSSLNPDFRATRVELMVAEARGDSVLSELGVGDVDLIKLDTESTEPQVLDGLTLAVDRHRPAIVVEVLHGRTEEDLEAFCRAHRYDPYWISGASPQSVDRIVGDDTYVHPNYLLLPEERPTFWDDWE